MKVFVTGASGFIGNHVISYLLEKKNAVVYALIRSRNRAEELDNSGVHLLEGDLFAVPPLPKDLDYIIHLAGSTKASQAANYYTVNQKGTASLLHSVKKQGIDLKRFVYLSSMAASGPGNKTRTIRENADAAPVSYYGRSKLLGEFEALKYKDLFSVVILRAAVIFGPRDQGIIPYFKIIKKGVLPALGFRPGPVSVCFVRDLARAISLSLVKNFRSGEIFNIADPIPRTWNEMGRLAGQAMGVKLTEIEVPLFLVSFLSLLSEVGGKLTKNPQIFSRDKFREMKQTGWIVDPCKAQAQLDFATQYSFEAALRETLDWYLEKGWL